MNNCWFENWFNTKYYHLLYKGRDEKEAQTFIDNLLVKLNLEVSSKILDVACGKGRHSKYLASKGFEVTGIDLSHESIKEAIAFETDKLTFFEHDMRLPFRYNYYDIAINLFTSLGYFEDDLDNYKAIGSIAKSIKSKGLIVIDFLNAAYVENNLISNFETEIDNINFLITKKIENGFVIKNIKVNDNGKTHQYQEKVQLISLNHFKNYFQSSNLNLIWNAGDYKLGRFDELNSERLIVCAQKS
jgi:SAM-dependent methyltransferase